MQPQLIAGRYQVLRAIGRGGMGTVWLCRDEVLGRQVAVKQIGALAGESATQTKRAMREARSSAALNHPNAVAVYDVVDHEGRPWLVMEYVEGQTLAQEISRDGRLSPERVADIGSQLASALARAHERRIVHRDIKPGNVLIDRAGRPKISDFGIARGHGDDQLTQVGFVTGTPGYLSPELARGGDPHPSSDVWALGATLYTAVEGQSPYEPRSNPIALLRAIATERPRPMTHAGALGPAIEAMMHEDPARRWTMAMSAKRLGRIAVGNVTAIMPRVESGMTKVMAVPPAETQRVRAAVPAAETQRLETILPPVVTPHAQPDVPPAGPGVTQRVQPVAPPAKPAGTQGVQPVAPPADLTRRPGAAGPVAATAAIVHRAPAGGGQRGGPTASPEDRTGGRRWLPLTLAALLVAALGVAYLLSPLGNQGGPAAVRATTSAAAPTTSSATSSPPTSSAPTSSAPTTVASTQNADQKLESFVGSYYSAVTKTRDQTWGQLTAAMQAATGSRHGYDGFWKTIAGVKVNHTTATSSAKTAVVNLTFTRNDGTRSTENHLLTFAASGGGYLINGDKLLR